MAVLNFFPVLSLINLNVPSDLSLPILQHHSFADDFSIEYEKLWRQGFFMIYILFVVFRANDGEQ